MRIISGSNGGQTIKVPKNFKLRPTTDQSKEGIFNIISNYYDYKNLEVLDLFSGTGNISYEFASRGAKYIRAIEINFKHYNFIKSEIKEENQAKIVAPNKQGLLVEILSGLDALRVNGAYSFIKRKFSAQADDYSKVTNSAKRFNQITTNYVSIVQQIAQIAIIVYGFHLFVEQRISMGAIIATMILSGKTLGPLAKMAQTLGRANSAYVARNNLVEFFSQQRRERFSKVGLENVRKNLGFKNNKH